MMNNFNIFGFFILVLVLGCQDLKPDAVLINTYPELDRLLEVQFEILREAELQKVVELDGKNETRQFKMDSSRLIDELSFLNDINPNKTEYIGAFSEVRAEDMFELQLKSNERGALKKLTQKLAQGKITSLQAIVHEDKDVYIHHQNISIDFVNGKIKSYIILGYQKILFKDTIKFRVEGRIL